jgi:mRNA interferase MazF
LRRGDIVTAALQGDQGKPRPALVVQADAFHDLVALTLLPITSTLVDAPLLRLSVQPSPANGLTQLSQIMIDKAQTPTRAKVGRVIGHLEDATMIEVSRTLAVFLGLA